MKRFLAAHSFLAGIGLAILLAAAAPEAGADGGILPVALLQSAGIFAIFFLQGLSLPLDELKRGLSDWKLHLCVQTTTFVFFPAIAFAGLAASAGFFVQPDLRLGFLYLSFLPTTIASAIAFTAAARGNVSGALFNTTLSNIGGVFLVPLLCLAFLGAGGASPAPGIGGILGGILLKIILPFLLGQACRLFARAWAGRHAAAIRRFNNAVILFIIYAAFCESFTGDAWADIAAGDLLAAFAGVLLLLAVASAFAWIASGLLRLGGPTRIAALFCGSQKTLAVGLPLALMIFGHGGPRVELGVLMIPLLIYHPAQLVLGGWLAPRFAGAFADHGEN